MRKFKVGAASINTLPLDWEGNGARIETMIRRAHAEQVVLLTLPELVVSSYGMEDAFFGAETKTQALESLRHIIKMIPEGMVVNLGLPFEFCGALYNCVAVCTASKVLALIPKQNLASDGIFYEGRWFKAWPAGKRCRTKVFPGGERVPIGDYVVDLDGVRIGYETCEDSWVHDRPGNRAAGLGIDFLSNSSASPFTMGKLRVRENLVCEGSRQDHCVFLYSNLLGNESGRLIFDGDCLVASAGSLVARGPRLTFTDGELTAAVVDIDVNRTLRQRVHSFKPALDCTDAIVETSIEIAQSDEPVTHGKIKLPDWEHSDDHENEETTRAILLGAFDYLRKSWSRGYVISLSGGADSSMSATLVKLMVHEGVRQLGIDGFKSKLSYIGQAPAGASPQRSARALAFRAATSPDELVRLLLFTIYQGTENSSADTLESAKQLASSLNAEFHVQSVQEPFEFYWHALEQIEGRDLTWEEDDITLQNIGPRVRPQIPWGVANLRGYLFVTTSNRTEAAVGYCSMDGDTSGGINFIGGLSKPWIRAWLRWMYRVGMSRIGSVPGLELVAETLEPSADLRPGGTQTDEKDLGSLDFLNEMEELLVCEHCTPRQIFQTMRDRHPNAHAAELYRQVRKFFFLLPQAQWKRERLAPSFHVDSRNLDPRSWLRLPILSAGYNAGLRELERHFAQLQSAV